MTADSDSSSSTWLGFRNGGRKSVLRFRKPQYCTLGTSLCSDMLSIIPGTIPTSIYHAHTACLV